MTRETALIRTRDATLARRIAQLYEAPSPSAGVLQLLQGVVPEHPAPEDQSEQGARRSVRKRSRQFVDVSAESTRALRTALRDVVIRGQAVGEMDATIDLEVACDLILAVMEGIEILTQGDASVEACHLTARFAVKRLSAR